MNSVNWYVIKESDGFIGSAPLPGSTLSKGDKAFLSEANNGKGGMVTILSGPYSSCEEAKNRIPNSRQSNSTPEIWDPIDVAVSKIFANSQDRTLENASLTVQALFAALSQYFSNFDALKQVFIDAVTGNNQYLNSRFSKINSRKYNSEHKFTGAGELTRDEEDEIIETLRDLWDNSNPLDSYIKVINYFIKNWGINKPLAPLGEFKNIEEYGDWVSKNRGTNPDLIGNIENFIASDDRTIDYIDQLPSEYNSRSNSRKCNSNPYEDLYERLVSEFPNLTVIHEGDLENGGEEFIEITNMAGTKVVDITLASDSNEFDPRSGYYVIGFMGRPPKQSDDLRDIINLAKDYFSESSNSRNSKFKGSQMDPKLVEKSARGYDTKDGEYYPMVVRIDGVDYNIKGRLLIDYLNSVDRLANAFILIYWGTASKLQKLLKSKGIYSFRYCEAAVGIKGYWGEGVRLNEDANKLLIDTFLGGVLTFDTLEDFKNEECKELSGYKFDRGTNKLVKNTTNSRIHKLNSRSN